MTGLAFFAAGVLFSSFVEYWVYRAMHRYLRFGQTHREHHARNTGQGVLWEFWDYVKPSFWLMFVMFLVSIPAGIGWLVGCFLYAVFSAYAHQLQHDNPAGCFWMRMPVHYVHHKYNMWHYNFGLAVDWWDHVFRTYKPVEWRDDLDPSLAARSRWSVRWW